MKNTLRVLSLALVGAISTSFVIAQDKTERDLIYDKFKACYKDVTDNTKISACIATGNELVQKNGKDEDFQEIITWVKKKIVGLEDAKRINQKNSLFEAFEKSLVAKNWTEVFSSGKNYISSNLVSDGEKFDAMIILATEGFNRVDTDKNDAYIPDTINYSKMLIEKIGKGEKGDSGDNWGPGTKSYKYDTKDNLLAWMNYYVGYVMYQRQQKTDDGVPYLYKSVQNRTTEISKKFEPYNYIAKWYISKMNKTIDERDALIKANNGSQNDESKKKEGEIKAISERAADAYARAYKIVSADPKNTKFANELKTFITASYKIRFGDKAATPAAVNTYITDVATRPFVDPMSPIIPVVEVVAPVTTTPTTTVTTPTTKPTATPTTKPTTTPTATPTTKPAVKPAAKPVAKKKGTR